MDISNDYLLTALQKTLQLEGIEALRDSIPNSPQDAESAVAFVLRSSSKSDHQDVKSFLDVEKKVQKMLSTELLFLQRQDGGFYSGDICLPGGKMEPGQTLLDTVIRETSQQTGIDLKKARFIGFVDQKFVARKIGRKALYTYAFVFKLEGQVSINLNHEQMSDFKWVKMRSFLDQRVFKGQPLPLSIYPVLKNLEGLDSVETIEYSAIDIGMKRHLYGFTLYILSYVVSQLLPFIEKTLEKIQLLQKNWHKTSLTTKLEEKQSLKRVKETAEAATISGKRIINRYFEPMKLNFKETIPEAQKKRINKTFIDFLRQNFTTRPRL